MRARRLQDRQRAVLGPCYWLPAAPWGCARARVCFRFHSLFFVFFHATDDDAIALRRRPPRAAKSLPSRAASLVRVCSARRAGACVGVPTLCVCVCVFDLAPSFEPLVLFGRCAFQRARTPGSPPCGRLPENRAGHRRPSTPGNHPSGTSRPRHHRRRRRKASCRAPRAPWRRWTYRVRPSVPHRTIFRPGLQVNPVRRSSFPAFACCESSAADRPPSPSTPRRAASAGVGGDGGRIRYSLARRRLNARHSRRRRCNSARAGLAEDLCPRWRRGASDMPRRSSEMTPAWAANLPAWSRSTASGQVLRAASSTRPRWPAARATAREGEQRVRNQLQGAEILSLRH